MRIYMTEPDRIYVSTMNKKTIERIDRDKFLGLNLSDCTRSDLYLFAMAYGQDDPSELIGKKEGLTLEKSISDRLIAIQYALYIYNNNLIKDENLQLITDKNKVFELCCKCANTGFAIIESFLSRKEEDVIQDLFIELDKLYENNVEK